MESKSKKTLRIDKCEKTRILLSLLVLIGFAISGVLEHSISSISTPPSDALIGVLQSGNETTGTDTRRYCEPPNMSALYYDSSEENVGENYHSAPTDDTFSQVQLTSLEKREFSIGSRLSLGMLLSFIPATQVAAKVGAKEVFGRSLLLMVTLGLFLHLLRPVLSVENVACVFGALIGALIPSFYQLSVNWFAPERRSSFVSLLSGKSLGYALWDVLLNNVPNIREKYYLYLGMAIITFLWYIPWFTMVRNDPFKEVSTSSSETKMKKSSGLRVSDSSLPWRKVLGSRPVWMSIGAIFGAFCGEIAIKKAMPLYLRHIYHVSGGYLSAISYLIHFIFAVCCGLFVDCLLKIKFVSVTSSRRMIVYVSHFIPAGFLFVIGFVGCDVVAPIVFYCLAGIVSGANYSGAFCSPLDLAPKYAGIIMALCTTVSMTASIFMNYLIPYVLAGQVLGSWRFIFSVTSLILLVSSIFFMLRGSGSVQPWSDPDFIRAKSCNKSQQRVSVVAPLPKPRAKSIYTVEKKILKVLHVQEPDKFTRVRAYSTSLPNERTAAGTPNVYKPSSKKRASIS